MSDYIELLAAALLLLLLLVSGRWRRPLARLADRTGWCMLALAVLPLTLRLALLRRNPVPIPSGSDDFGYLLLADTLRHFRLANPPHALPQFFEQIFVLQQPTHSSIYPLGQGLLLALGWAVFGHPWAGVLLAGGALCALCYWMLRAWTTPNWSLAGGLLAVFTFGPLSYWTNSYWGGAVSACAGCLVFGALLRISKSQSTRGQVLVGGLLGLGLGLQLLTRPYEFFLLLASVGLFLVMDGGMRIRLPVTWAAAFGVLACAGGLTLLHNKQVTGQWSSIPYDLYRYRYGIPATFTWQANAVPHGELNSEQELDYRTETAVHGPGPETVQAYLERLVFRARFYRFFILAPLYLALLAFFTQLRQRRLLWALCAVLIFILGSNFFPYFYPHYIAAVSCLFILACVIGLERLNRLTLHVRAEAGTLLLFLCVAHFALWYGMHAWGNPQASFELAGLETWDYIGQGDPQGRAGVDRQLAQQPGKQLVFVRYAPSHRFQEWIKNEADIDAAQVVWAHDLGASENEKLRRYYPRRTVWLLQPDVSPPKLSPFPAEKTSIFQDVQ